MLSVLKKITSNYLSFGVGIIFGSLITSIVGTVIFQIATGDKYTMKIMNITECLEQKVK